MSVAVEAAVDTKDACVLELSLSLARRVLPSSIGCILLSAVSPPLFLFSLDILQLSLA